MQWFWFLCLTIAAVWDIKERMVSCKVLAVCTGVGMIYALATGIACHIYGLAAGAGILLLSKATRGSIGAGDGWFLTASAWYLNSEEIWTLLFGGLSVSWCLGAGFILYSALRGRNAGKATLPFLACMWPVGIWILVQRGSAAWLSAIAFG